ncbi:MAG: peptide deformylase [Candidatus Omnitrophica bacterium CG11_big_fil_rev_8_21_14_0_20_64_10]|nr:MAG: peptide deformylase [Candidatus Omnitrophica bacterium CG11_big_fil_rev_8_21_14_0_20_64_10]
MILPITKEPEPILRAPAVPIDTVTDEIRRLARNMIETMHAADGVGLAANQVASPLDLFVASPDGKPGRELAVVNGRIVERRGAAPSAEGCLSVPGVSEEIRRAVRVKLTGLNLEGRPITIETEGLLAKVLQHETDHLQGRFFFDHLGWLPRRRLLSRYRELRRTLGEINL